jgi:hypothetical protein
MTRASVLAGALVALLVISTPASAQWLKTPTPGIPRTPDGKPNLTAPAPKSADGRPDLSGLWRADPGGYSLNIVSDLKVSEIMPWAEEIYKRHFVITDEDRRKSRSTVKGSPEILSRYVGTYEGMTPTGRKETFEVKFDGERLTAAPPGGGGYVLVPESDAAFSASGAPVIFHVDAKGVATDFVVHTVEGDQRYVKIK